MNCGCNYGYDDGGGDFEPATLWREGRTASTRREWRCCECGDVIPVGSRCCYSTALFEGRWVTDRRCLTCSLLAELVATEKKACPQWGMLEETLTEMHDYGQAGELPTWDQWRESAERFDAEVKP